MHNLKIINMDSHISPTTKPIYRGTQIVWYILGIIEALLAIRIILDVMDANQGAGFTSFINQTTSIFISPFSGVFYGPSSDGSFGWAILLAMLVYWFVAWAVVKLLIMSKSLSTPEAAEKLKEENK
jgi:hypothetical protein